MVDVMQALRRMEQALARTRPSALSLSTYTAVMVRNLPSVRLIGHPGFPDAYLSSADPAIDRFWARCDGYYAALGGAAMQSRRSRCVLAHLTVTYPVSMSLSVAVAACAGAQACLAAARLYRAGEPDAAAARLQQNAFEVFWTLRMVENAALLSASVLVLKAIARASVPIRA